MGLDAIRQVVSHPVRGVGFLPVLAGGKVLAWTDGREYHPGKGWNASPTGFDDLISEYVAGKSLVKPWSKYGDVLGRGQNWGWNDFFPCAGNPQPGSYTGTAKTLRQLDDTVAGAMYHGGNVSTDTKHLLWQQYNQANIFGGLNNLGVLLIVDRVATYEACPMGTSTQSMTNSLTAQRYVGTGLPGLQIVCTTQVNHTSNGGTLASLTYVDQDNNSTSLPGPTLITLDPQQTPSTTACACVNSGGEQSPFLPLAAGDSGVRSITDYTTNQTDATGKLCFALVYPIAFLAIADASSSVAFGMADYVRRTPGMARIQDGAYLNMMGLHRSNSQTVYINGMLGFGWG